MAGLGLPELLIVLVIVIVLFGVGRLSRIGGELGEAIGNFRKGVREASKDDDANTGDASQKINLFLERGKIEKDSDAINFAI